MRIVKAIVALVASLAVTFAVAATANADDEMTHNDYPGMTHN